MILSSPQSSPRRRTFPEDVEKGEHSVQVCEALQVYGDTESLVFEVSLASIRCSLIMRLLWHRNFSIMAMTFLTIRISSIPRKMRLS